MTLHIIPRSQLLFKTTLYHKIFYPIYQFLWEAFVTRGQIYDPKGPEQWKIAIKQFRRRRRFDGYQALVWAFGFQIMGGSMIKEEMLPFGIVLIALGFYFVYVAHDLIKYGEKEELYDEIKHLKHTVQKNAEDIKKLKDKQNSD